MQAYGVKRKLMPGCGLKGHPSDCDPYHQERTCIPKKVFKKRARRQARLEIREYV